MEPALVDEYRDIHATGHSFDSVLTFPGLQQEIAGGPVVRLALAAKPGQLQ